MRRQHRQEADASGDAAIGDVRLTIPRYRLGRPGELSVAVFHFVAKFLGVYRPATPCSVDVARIRELADMLAADNASVLVSHP